MIGKDFVQSCLIWEQPVLLVSSEVPFAKLWSEECSYITISENVEVAVHICSSKKGVLINFPIFTRYLWSPFLIQLEAWRPAT